jgi:hypothetical protein
LCLAIPTKRAADTLQNARERDDQNRDLAINPVYRILALPSLKEHFMTETVVKLRLNQQQLELMDRTIAQGIAPDRVSLVRLALREYAAARKAEAKTEPAR